MTRRGLLRSGAERCSARGALTACTGTRGATRDRPHPVPRTAIARRRAIATAWVRLNPSQREGDDVDQSTPMGAGTSLLTMVELVETTAVSGFDTARAGGARLLNQRGALACSISVGRCSAGYLSVLLGGPTRDAERADELALLVRDRNTAAHEEESTVGVVEVGDRFAEL